MAIEAVADSCFQKLTLKEVADHVSNVLDANDSGYWLCHIYPQEIDSSLVLTKYKSLQMQFEKDEAIYEVEIAQTQTDQLTVGHKI